MKTFSIFQECLDAEQSVREAIKTSTKIIEENTRKLTTMLQIIHQKGSSDRISTVCQECKPILAEIKEKYAELAKEVTVGLYYKYYDHWKMVTQKLCFIITLIHYLETGTLKTRDEVAAVLGLATREQDGFHLAVEDYLFGVLTLISELARFAVNSVTNEDYERPMQISDFVSHVNAGFRLMSLKNDNLRKRYDGLKYDIKKIEEVVYDLAIRGLKPTVKKVSTP
jgi:predicted translin family RNA/ssDNA-binding protein